MPVFKFRIIWDDDDNISRDIEILSNQSFDEFHTFIQKSFALKTEWAASFYIINSAGKRTYEINTLVEKNLKNAPALSCKRTPVGAMVTSADQEFIYAVMNDKEWDFRINLLSVDKNPIEGIAYPLLVRSDGPSPMEQAGNSGKESFLDVEEKYDLGSEDGDDEGFGFDDEQGSDQVSDDHVESYDE
jgi:hypothetical protein